MNEYYQALEQRVHEARDIAMRSEQKVDSHEAVCAERYSAIFTGLHAVNGKLWALVIGVSATLIVGLTALLITIVLIWAKNGAPH